MEQTPGYGLLLGYDSCYWDGSGLGGGRYPTVEGSTWPPVGPASGFLQDQWGLDGVGFKYDAVQLACDCDSTLWVSVVDGSIYLDAWSQMDSGYFCDMAEEDCYQTAGVSYNLTDSYGSNWSYGASDNRAPGYAELELWLSGSFSISNDTFNESSHHDVEGEYPDGSLSRRKQSLMVYLCRAIIPCIREWLGLTIHGLHPRIGGTTCRHLITMY